MPARFTVDRLLIALLFLVAALYFVWVLLPFNEEIEINDRVGLPEERIKMLTGLANEIGAYKVVPIEELKTDSRLVPWRKPRFFITIQGTASAVEVRAGFHGGVRYGYGSGKSFHATWTGKAWEINERTLTQWKATDADWLQREDSLGPSRLGKP